MKCPSFKELQSFSKDDLERLYDQETTSTYVGINFILDEISRREQAKENKELMKLGFLEKKAIM